MPKSLEDQTQSLANYLPSGRAWAAKNLQDTVTRATLEGFAGELVRNEELLEEFKQEILPDQTTLFIDEWERALGIPCECFTGTGTVEERRNDILAKLAALGVQTAEDMRLLALRIYGIDITVTTPEIDTDNDFPYTFPATFGVSEREARFTLIINYNDLPNVLKFPYTFPVPFLTKEIQTLECIFAKTKPANVGFFTQSEVPPPVPPPIPPHDNGGMSLNFDRSDWEHLSTGITASTEDFTLANTFSAMAWVKTDGAIGNSNNTVFMLGNPLTGTNPRIKIRHDQAAGEFQAYLYKSPAGVKQYEFGSPGNDTWYCVAFTYDDSADILRVYVDGVEDASPTKTGDGNPIFNSVVARGCIGADGSNNHAYDGLIHQVGLWSSILTPAEITAIYNGGDGNAFDLNSDSGDYASSASLQHWYLLGVPVSPDLGEDVTDGAVPVDISVENGGIDDTNITADAPTG